MENQLLKTIPLEVALEYYSDAARKNREAGTFLERKRIIELLKKTGHYEAILVIKQSLDKDVK